MKLVIVESPTKAKTISKFLGKDYIVTSCMGHIRDLPSSAKELPEKYKKEPWAQLGVNVSKDFSPIYCIPRTKSKVIRELKQALLKSDELILATDEDREGESISWHLLEVLAPKVPVKRMIFHEITKKAIDHALKNCRDIDQNLVQAQEARRVIDRLVGYTISPLLWKKIAYGLSAGRVQSVAIKLITEKESGRITFKKSNYNNIAAEFQKQEKSKNFDLKSELVSYDSKKIAKGVNFDEKTGELLDKNKDMLWLDEKQAQEIEKEISKETPFVNSIETKPISKKPSPPFITSTLQQEANRRFNWTARETMSIAQKLYERGLITYMRTDSTFLSDQSLQGARSVITQLYGKNYLPDSPRLYKKSAKAAQEAHEAIRPAGETFSIPETSGLRGTTLELYSLIFKRTLASQMKDAQQKQTSLRIKLGKALFSSSGVILEFDGFLKAYGAPTSQENPLPPMKEKDELTTNSLKVTSHETKPPARYTEASLIQKLEQEGVGRPSTYASIISTIQDRGYVKKQANTLFPTFTAMVVIHFLNEYLPDYVDLKFTSKMEDSLDEIAKGNLNKVSYLSDIYSGADGLKQKVDFQEKNVEPEKARQLQLDTLKGISLRIGRYGAYICRLEDKEEVCSSLPENLSPGELTQELAHKIIDDKKAGHDSLGEDPETKEPVFALSGRYGPYVQRGDASDTEVKPKRVSLPPQWQLEDIDFQKALWLLQLPRHLGDHPETKKEIRLGIGRFGPFIVHDGDFRSVPKTHDITTVDLAWSLEVLSQPKSSRLAKKVLKTLGKHPDTEEEVQILKGKYGEYIKCGKVNASIPDDLDPEKTTLKEALELLEVKMATKKKKKVTKKTTTKKTASKAATKKPKEEPKSEKPKIIRKKKARS